MSNFVKSIEQLSEWFLSEQRVLPWRNDPSIYRVWVSEIMLQQTQVATVIPYFERFLERFPDVDTLASAHLDDVLQYWAGLGYYSRARNIHKTARLVVENGGFPVERDGWLALPGVGGYTAGAVLSIALNQPEAILDANVKKVISRLRLLPTDEKSKSRLWKWSKIILTSAVQAGIEPRVINQALMELGALICLPKKPLCHTCPFNTVCKAFKTGQAEVYPGKKIKSWLQLQEKVVCLIRGGSVLLVKPDTGWRQGLWDFPSVLPEGVKSPVFMDEWVQQVVVTNHKISRTVQVYRLEHELIKNSPSGKWFALQELLDKPSAIGAPVRKSLRKILALIKK